MFGASSQTDAAFVANVVIVVVADVVVDNFDRCVGRKTIDDSAMIRHCYKYKPIKFMKFNLAHVITKRFFLTVRYAESIPNCFISVEKML